MPPTENADQTMSLKLLRGAHRVQSYPEPVGPPTGAYPLPTPSGAPGPAAQMPTPPPGVWSTPTTPVAAPVKPGPATWGWRGRLRRGTGGLLKPGPATAELAHREAIAQIQAATWGRAVNVLVANPKGGVGKTPAAVILAGILGQIRAGGVAVWEAAESAGTLTARTEGAPPRGLGELLAGLGGVRSMGNLAAFTSPQSSHVDVIGTVGARKPLVGDDILGVRRVLDTYYRMTVTDTGNNPDHYAFLAALHTTDAVLVPCLPTIDALAGVEQLGHLIHSAPGRPGGNDGLIRRVVIVLGHDGGPENSTIATEVRARLDALGLPVVEVPYDPTIRDGGPITLDALSEESVRAWTATAAAVVTALQAAPTREDLVRMASTPRPPARTGPTPATNRPTH